MQQLVVEHTYFLTHLPVPFNYKHSFILKKKFATSMKRALGDNKRSLVNTKCYAVDRVFCAYFWT